MTQAVREVTNLTVITVTQCICMPNHYPVRLETMHYLSIKYFTIKIKHSTFNLPLDWVPAASICASRSMGHWDTSGVMRGGDVMVWM